jgi:alpha/beta superfamily hydrolase
MLRDIQGPVGRLETILDEPAATTGVNPPGLVETGRTAPPRAAVVVGHPHPQHGGTMHTKGTYQAAKALARIGCAVLRFNFRGVGRSEGAYAEGDGERADFAAALDVMAVRYPGTPLWAAGMSFGAWVGLSVGAEDPRVSALIGIAMPVDRYDFSAVRESAKAKFFIHGEFDELCSVHLLRGFYAQAAEPKELAVIETANHLFEGKVSLVGDTLEDLLSDWPEG